MTLTTVRYFVTDVDEAIDFYCNSLGFHVDLPLAPGFAATMSIGSPNIRPSRVALT